MSASIFGAVNAQQSTEYEVPLDQDKILFTLAQKHYTCITIN